MNQWESELQLTAASYLVTLGLVFATRTDSCRNLTKDGFLSIIFEVNCGLYEEKSISKVSKMNSS